jgi:hypothetical protein
VKKPSQRITYLTWKPYGYSRRIRINRARRRCINSKNLYVIEARSAMQKRRTQMEFDSDSYEILIDNCCSHSLTNSKEDFIEPPVKSKVRVRGYNGHTNSTMVGTVKWRVKDDNGKVTTLNCQTHITHHQWKQGFYHHNTGLKSEVERGTHTV